MDQKAILKYWALALGPLLFLIIQIANPQFWFPEIGWDVFSIALWMIVWWVFEAIPIFATALLPMVLFPSTGVFNLSDATTPYASPIIFLFMGGFMLALAMEKHQLHRRIALNLIRLTGTNANGIILGFMLATAVLSMWISNTATAVMMLPIALSVVKLLEAHEDTFSGFNRFKAALFLGIAYSANVGGMATIIGTPPNVVLVGLVKSILGKEISFASWLIIGIPTVAIMLIIIYQMLTKVLFPHGITKIEKAELFIGQEIKQLGNWSKEEKWVAIIFSITALCWIFKSQVNSVLGIEILNDTVTAMSGGLATFLIPLNKSGKMLMNWEDMKNLPWGILILFGGGMTLAKAMETAGFVDMIGEAIRQYQNIPLWLLLLILTTLALFLTEVMSNVALTTIAIPMVLSIATGLDVDPLLLAIPVAMATSCAFMMPISTPPNAIVFSSGYISIKQMVRAGILLNLIAVIVLVVAGYFLAPFVGG
ncbi:SLC13 family permease [Marivirga tractuosa]|uniref:Anion transporter n=1 Tax=Marivirga tractuosa (strain ATCC 23168 / DSM 4126 / NBRC 15989 / NCIMB 1408 / VKM B-1430 / H-43) TaxID=643867 RepID=E4TVR7_MARTH|nr:DASS family sodium-coupled anion symporter [Marivirga tractuosa]ADR22165.1 anion transporter [Marivirga tractuosa DSM 4126]BDD13372.1 SLC13 family permease [Marivirga tractuosa]